MNNCSGKRKLKQRLDYRLLPAALVVAFLFCGIVAVPAGAENLSSILDQSRYSASERLAIASAFQQFEAEGVPQDMLFPRLEQGIARGVPSNVVIEVLSQNARLLVRARSVLQTVAGGEHYIADQSAWSLSATILGTGGDSSTIRMLAQASNGSELKYRSALVLYGSLADWGLDSQDLLQVTLAAVRSPLPASQYVSISGIFIRGRAEQISPQQIAKRLIEALPRSQGFQDLQRAVLY